METAGFVPAVFVPLITLIKTAQIVEYEQGRRMFTKG